MPNVFYILGRFIVILFITLYISRIIINLEDENVKILTIFTLVLMKVIDVFKQLNW